MGRNRKLHIEGCVIVTKLNTKYEGKTTVQTNRYETKRAQIRLDKLFVLQISLRKYYIVRGFFRISVPRRISLTSTASGWSMTY